MRHSLQRRLCSGLLVGTLAINITCLWAGEPAGSGEAEEEKTALGEALFLHNWARPETWQRPEPLGNGGDGLGPVFNETSCVACHSQGGPGGAGLNEHNVELLSVVIPPQTRPLRRTSLLQRARALHPQFAPDNLTVLLHQYGFGPADETFDYDSWRLGVVETAQESRRILARANLTKSEAAQQIPLMMSQRNTPALWGLGEIERLRRAGGDRLRRQIAVEQNSRGDGVSGRLPRTAAGRSSWLGWRGHVEHLPEFVLNACANELGLAVSNHPQPVSPLGKKPHARSRSMQDLDLTNEQVIALTSYVASLPRPERVFPTAPAELEEVSAGERVFDAIGCTTCHVPDLAVVKEVYSDLLLHDMGASLADPVSAFPEQAPPPRFRSSGSYSGGSSPPPTGSPGEMSITRTRLTHEWRTPPLWGVADSAPYLHDGRAATLDEAIRLHEGEARHSSERYRGLSDGERSQLLAFLGTLRAPQMYAGVPDRQD